MWASCFSICSPSIHRLPRFVAWPSLEPDSATGWSNRLYGRSDRDAMPLDWVHHGGLTSWVVVGLPASGSWHSAPASHRCELKLTLRLFLHSYPLGSP
jgi:hypothetical protein